MRSPLSSPRPLFPALPLPSAAVSVNGPTECPERRRRRRRPDSGRLKGREKGKGNFIQKGGFPLPPSLSPANSVQACGDARTKFYSLRFPAQNEKDPLVSSRLSRPTPSHGCSPKRSACASSTNPG